MLLEAQNQQELYTQVHAQNQIQPRPLPVQTILKWQDLISQDLQIPYVPVLVKPEQVIDSLHRYGAASIHGWVEIYTVPWASEYEYLNTLAHELRHIWQFYTGQFPLRNESEQDAKQYAQEFTKIHYRNCAVLCVDYL